MAYINYYCIICFRKSPKKKKSEEGEDEPCLAEDEDLLPQDDLPSEEAADKDTEMKDEPTDNEPTEEDEIDLKKDEDLADVESDVDSVPAKASPSPKKGKKDNKSSKSRPSRSSR